MKKCILLILAAGSLLTMAAQVTQINSNRSLKETYPLSSTKSVYVSDVDETLWVTDASLAGTIQLSTGITYAGQVGSTAFMNGKFIFAGTTLTSGTELYITDGTPLGTVLLKDINPGPTSSSPGIDAAILNGFLYFTAERIGEGRELWRTDGTADGTTLVKDVLAGPSSSNTQFGYHLFSNGSYLLFAANTTGLGVELWKSDGTPTGTALLEDINTGSAGASSSSPYGFQQLNNVVLFVAKTDAAGEEIWRSDGTAAGTFQLGDINPGVDSSTYGKFTIEGEELSLPVFGGFHNFGSKAYFIASNGTSNGTLWSTDGTVVNTVLVKEIIGGTDFAQILLVDALNVANKFIFPLSDFQGRSELWESDGTTSGTKIFKAFAPGDPESFPFILIPYDFASGGVSTNFFQGNKFFFVADSDGKGNELWISDGIDGTAAHTYMVEDINPGSASGINQDFTSYIYTSAGIYFPADNGTNGLELWKSDGTLAGTSMVADLVTGAAGSEVDVNFYLVNSKILFGANNGDNATLSDLYVVQGSFDPLPITLGDFTVQLKVDDAHLHWFTEQELNTKHFTVQRSFDGLHYQELTKIAAAGNSTNRKAYSFIDAGINRSGRDLAYYRLVTTDLDGTSSVSPVIALRLKNNLQWTIRLLSNPVPGALNILLTGVKDELHFTVLDLSGKRLLTRSMPAVNGQISLPVNNLAKGSYVLVVETKTERKSLQFIK
ncbi:MAG: T9SS type A sorting domain-containing protein [Ferruginibacter sp.]|nr:T9SS type A sorting domain-containing protein [Ferruginibacter sp.]